MRPCKPCLWFLRGQLYAGSSSAGYPTYSACFLLFHPAEQQAMPARLSRDLRNLYCMSAETQFIEACLVSSGEAETSISHQNFSDCETSQYLSCAMIVVSNTHLGRGTTKDFSNLP